MKLENRKLTVEAGDLSGTYEFNGVDSISHGTTRLSFVINRPTIEITEAKTVNRDWTITLYEGEYDETYSSNLYWDAEHRFVCPTDDYDGSLGYLSDYNFDYSPVKMIASTDSTKTYEWNTDSDDIDIAFDCVINNDKLEVNPLCIINADNSSIFKTLSIKLFNYLIDDPDIHEYYKEGGKIADNASLYDVWARGNYMVTGSDGSEWIVKLTDLIPNVTTVNLTKALGDVVSLDANKTYVCRDNDGSAQHTHGSYIWLLEKDGDNITKHIRLTVTGWAGDCLWNI